MPMEGKDVNTLLVIDDEESVRYSFRSIFSVEDTEVLTAATGQEGLKIAREKNPDVVVVDLQLPDQSGLEVFGEIHDFAPKKPVIFITAHGTTQTAIEAMKRGAFDYLIKPLDLERLSQVIERAFEAARLMTVPATLPAEDVKDQIVGRSAVMQEMCKMIGRIAPQDVNVLITGENGTGKELVARALYSHSRRAEKPFLAVNCAAIPEQLLESELFGHEAGAYTGATRRRIGKFEQCGGGTLFLDEIGDMPPSLQAKILRVLQEQRFERLGGNELIQTHVRVLAATNQDLPKLITEARFRKDLYYRLNAVTIHVPPLRQRLEDVAELAHYFLFRFNRELSMDLRGFAPEVLEKFQAYGWPGNVRELQGAVKQAMLNASGHLILPEFLADSLMQPAVREAVIVTEFPNLSALIDRLLQDSDGKLHDTVIAAVERLLFAKILEHTHGNQGKACELLGLNRSTLRHRLRTLGLGVDKVPVASAKKEQQAED
jgi:two-component system, NtrC family, nitrogen regulation response regulator GlnG